MSAGEQYPDGRRFPIGLSPGERKMILHLRTLDSEMKERVKRARVRGSSVAVSLNAYDVFDLLELISAEARREKNLNARRQVDSLHRKLKSTLDFAWLPAES